MKLFALLLSQSEVKKASWKRGMKFLAMNGIQRRALERGLRKVLQQCPRIVNGVDVLTPIQFEAVNLLLRRLETEHRGIEG